MLHFSLGERHSRLVRLVREASTPRMRNLVQALLFANEGCFLGEFFKRDPPLFVMALVVPSDLINEEIEYSMLYGEHAAQDRGHD